MPQQPTEQVISNSTINPGDEIFNEVWFGTGETEPTAIDSNSMRFDWKALN